MKTIAVYNTYVARSAALLAAFCTLSVFLYGIFLLMAVAHTAARTAAERKINTITANLGNIEMQYLTQQRSLTPELAQELGFEKPQVVSTVFSTARTNTLTINSNR